MCVTLAHTAAMMHPIQGTVGRGSILEIKLTHVHAINSLYDND